jgi:polynucleotide 5'-triphosphatase
MMYEHIYEIDTFHTLSPLGLSVLPSAFSGSRRISTPRLRVTKDQKTGKVKARIVKMRVADLHIFSPRSHHDCRISINLEVNLDRPGLDPADLIQDDGKINEPERRKDRLSYKHLCYSMDLTKVESPGHRTTYEMELEVDSNILREHRQALLEGRDSAYGDIVGGFLDNTTFLMRETPPGEPK